jgi:hypothetical protein
MWIFINYRREDTRGITGRIYDRLCHEFGKKQVFRDIDNIGPGAAFVQAIRGVLQDCKIVLVIIGRQWPSVRLAEQDDPVRLEIEVALYLFWFCMSIGRLMEAWRTQPRIVRFSPPTQTRCSTGAHALQ